MISTLQCEGMETRSGLAWPSLWSRDARLAAGRTEDLFQCYPGDHIRSTSLSAPHLLPRTVRLSWQLDSVQGAVFAEWTSLYCPRTKW